MRTKSSIFNSNFVAVKLFAMENINRYIISQLKRPVDRLKLMAIGNIINILSAKELCSLYDEIAEITDDSNIYDWDAIHKILRWVRRATC